jgi:ubiquinone biosynthesis protein
VERDVTKGERYREISSALARHGIGVAYDQLIKHEAGPRARAEHLRKAFEELGTLFVKLGQALSTRGDLLSEAYRAELAKLQDEVAPIPTGVIAEVIREDLGAPPDALFQHFDTEPLGSASIGQVHAARLLDGRDVVLKVRKPGVESLVQVDLEILTSLVEEWSARFPVLARYDARGLVREFGDTLRAELNYAREAEKQKLFRGVFSSNNGFKIPEVIERYSRERVLTAERLNGMKISEACTLPQVDRVSLSRRLARFVLEPAFERGIFYADPHPGNLMILDAGTLGIVDFGKIGHLSPEMRRRVVDIFIAVDRRDSSRLADRLIDITAPTRPVDRAAITSEIERILALYVDVALARLHFGEAVNDLLRLVRDHGLRLPGNLVQFFKALSMCEGILREIDPQTSLADYVRPIVGEVSYRRLVGRSVDRVRDSALDAVDLGLELPRRMERLLGEAERGNLRVWVRVENVELLLKRLERVAERTNATLLAAACIVALAIVMLVYQPQGWRGWIAGAFWVGVVAAAAGAVRTLWALRQ